MGRYQRRTLSFRFFPKLFFVLRCSYEYPSASSSSILENDQALFVGKEAAEHLGGRLPENAEEPTERNGPATS